MAEEPALTHFCTNCGAVLPPAGEFCPTCGTRFREPEPPTASTGRLFGDGPVSLQFLGTGLQALVTGLAAFVLMILIIPYGWGVSLLSGWYVNHLAFSDGRTAQFTGRGSQIWYYIFILVPMFIIGLIPLIGFIINILIYGRIQLAIARWFFTNIRLSTGQILEFEGRYWPLIGWYLLWTISIYTIIGWAWVASAGMRWLCRNVDMGEEHLEFTGSGLEFLWRGFLVALVSILIITIPWMVVWYIRWITSKIEIHPGATQQS